MTMALSFTLLISTLFVISLSSQPSRYGPYGKDSCTVEQIYIGNMVDNGSEYAFIVYPTEALSSNTILPYVTFAHGAEAGGNGTKGVYGSYGSLLQSVCSYGYVIVAPEACLGLCTSFYQDVIRTINTVKTKNSALSKGLSIANFSKTGLFGHSTG